MKMTSKKTNSKSLKRSLKKWRKNDAGLNVLTSSIHLHTTTCFELGILHQFRFRDELRYIVDWNICLFACDRTE